MIEALIQDRPGHIELAIESMNLRQGRKGWRKEVFGDGSRGAWSDPARSCQEQN